MQIVNFQAEKTKFPARLPSDTRTGKNHPAYSYTAAGIPCFTRSCSSARLALLKRSSVPTR